MISMKKNLILSVLFLLLLLSQPQVGNTSIDKNFVEGNARGISQLQTAVPSLPPASSKSTPSAQNSVSSSKPASSGSAPSSQNPVSSSKPAPSGSASSSQKPVSSAASSPKSGQARNPGSPSKPGSSQRPASSQNTGSPQELNRKQLKLLFQISGVGDMQGVAYEGGNYYIGFDLHDGINARIDRYNSAGKLLDSAKLPVGHCSEIAVSYSSHHLFISNGSARKTAHIYEVDYGNGANAQILKDMDFSGLGSSALVAVDNQKGDLIVHTARNDFSQHEITVFNLATMQKISSFSIPYQGIPQGLEACNDRIYLLTNNKITTISDNGALLSTNSVSEKGESEGMTLVTENNRTFFAAGRSRPNRLYEISDLSV